MLRKRTRTPDEFWRWFCRTSRVDTDPYKLIKQVGRQLRDVHPSLVMEVSAGSERPRDLVISADGIREAAEHVEALVDAAPPIPGWNIVRFRPRMEIEDGTVVTYEGADCDISMARAGAVRRGSAIDIHLFAPWRFASSDRNPDGPSFIALDMALGEWMVMMCVGEIVVRPLEEAPKQTVPLGRLHELLETILNQHAGDAN